MATARDIGVDVQAPTQECTDPHCPFHGGFPVRGQILEGQVVGTRMERSARVQREYTWYVPKYERFAKRTSSYNVHAPPCLEVQVGDWVKIMECRPISKTKAFVVVEAKRGALRIEGEDATADESAVRGRAEGASSATVPAKEAGVAEESE